MQKEQKGSKSIIVIIICLIVIVIALIIGMVVVHNLKTEKTVDSEEEQTQQIAADTQNTQEAQGDGIGSKFSYSTTTEQTSTDGGSKFSRNESAVDPSLLASNVDTGFSQMSAQEKFEYTLTWLNDQNPQLKLIDYEANQQIPAPRDTSLEWDRSLFYGLEDVSVTDPNDGLINYCDVKKVQLVDSATEEPVECEVYTDPDSDAIKKIVTIEKQEDTGLYEVWEYYYEGEDVNFIFYSLRDVYTPTYATPDKCGERYYYNHAHMVKFRRIAVPNQINDYLVQKLTTYTPDIVSGFDNLEIVGLTRAYNVYHSVQNTPIFGTLKGYVYDANNQPIAGALIAAHNNHYGKDVGSVKTDNDGYYSIMVPSDDEGDYDLLASADGADSVKIYDVKVDDATSNINNEMLYMPVGDQKSETYDMEIVLCDALNVGDYGDSYLAMQRLSGATLKVRKGVNNRSGEIYGTYQADADGVVYTSLPTGMYTGEIVKEGYENSYFTFATKKDNTKIQSMTTPKLNDNEVRIVLTWGSQPNDLDSHLFTPYPGTAGDMQHIGYYERSDAYGNNLDVDDTSAYGPETMTILDLNDGNYKYYVSNFSSLSSGVTDDMSMSESGATVRVYTSAGLAATFNVPQRQEGTIWEVFEIRNKRIIPIQRYYSSVDDKSWWCSY